MQDQAHLVLVQPWLDGNQFSDPFTVALVVDVGFTLVVWMLSVLVGNTSLYDPYWCLWPLIASAYWGAYCVVTQGASTRLVVAVALVFCWGLRHVDLWMRRLGWELVGELARGSSSKRGWRARAGLPSLFHAHEDWRYRLFGELFGGRDSVAYWVLGSLLLLQLVPTLFVACGLIPLWVAISEAPQGLGKASAFGSTWDMAGVLLGAWGVWLEWRADGEMDAFVARPQAKGQVLRTGLWKWSRHPNYVGELAFWTALWCFAMAAHSDKALWTAIGPLAMLLLIGGTSVKMMEDHLRHKNGWDQYAQETAPLIPLRAYKLLPILCDM